MTKLLASLIFFPSTFSQPLFPKPLTMGPLMPVVYNGVTGSAACLWVTLKRFTNKKNFTITISFSLCDWLIFVVNKRTDRWKFACADVTSNCQVFGQWNFVYYIINQWERVRKVIDNDAVRLNKIQVFFFAFSPHNSLFIKALPAWPF